VRVADVALPGKGHAKRAVNEELQRRRGASGDFADLIERQLARQHDLRKADVAEELGLLHAADVGLRARVQLDRRQIELQQAHVLHDQRIRAGLVQLPGQAPRALQLVVVENGVERGEHAGVEAVRVSRQPGDVADLVAGMRTRAEGRTADINGVGPVFDGLDADIGVLGGGEEFEVGRHGAAILPAAGSELPGLSAHCAPIPLGAPSACMNHRGQWLRPFHVSLEFTAGLVLGDWHV